tara:strand:+ start:336 stop:587 length:252 start_codon:yes stop_codon:yes gene_type:complete
MTAQEVLNEYLTFLWQQFQYDWGWISNPWVFWLIIPELFYLAFFTIKWMVLLAPITIPIMVFKWPTGKQPSVAIENKDKFFNN